MMEMSCTVLGCMTTSLVVTRDDMWNLLITYMIVVVEKL